MVLRSACGFLFYFVKVWQKVTENRNSARVNLHNGFQWKGFQKFMKICERMI